MDFIRSRKEDGAGGDFGRQERQQLILEAMADKLTSASSITHFNTLMNQIQKNVKTDLKLVILIQLELSIKMLMTKLIDIS